MCPHLLMFHRAGGILANFHDFVVHLQCREKKREQKETQSSGAPDCCCALLPWLSHIWVPKIWAAAFLVEMPLNFNGDTLNGWTEIQNGHCRPKGRSKFAPSVSGVSSGLPSSQPGRRCHQQPTLGTRSASRMRKGHRMLQASFQQRVTAFMAPLKLKFRS